MFPTSIASSIEFLLRTHQVKSDVQGRRRMRERPHRQVVNPGRRHVGRCSSRSPPLASSSTRPPTSATASRSSSSEKLSSRIRSAPAPTASATCSRVSHSTSTTTSGASSLHRPERGGHRPSRRHVIVLDQRRIPERHPMVDPAAAPHRVLLQHPQPGQRLAGVPHPRAASPPSASHHDRVRLAIPDIWVRRFNAVRSAVRIARSGPWTVIRTWPGLTRSPSLTRCVTWTSRSRPCRDGAAGAIDAEDSLSHRQDQRPHPPDLATRSAAPGQLPGWWLRW